MSKCSNACNLIAPILQILSCSYCFFSSLADFTGNADMPFDFFLTRYNEAYEAETIAFCESLVKDTPVPCTGEDGLAALVMSIAADASARENRWVTFREIVERIYCKYIYVEFIRGPQIIVIDKFLLVLI